MDNELQRPIVQCHHPVKASMFVNQVVGREEEQKTIDIHIVVPRHKPLIEQIIDVFIKRITITDVRVITDEVIVCGHFEVKALYVACLPDQPVHAVEVRRIRFTIAVPVCGARCGMDVDASILVEYVDYDLTAKVREERLKGYHGEYGKYGFDDEDCDDDPGYFQQYGPEQSYYYNYDFKPHHKPDYPHHPEYPHHPHFPHFPHCPPACMPYYHHKLKGYCEFDVWVVLKACVKVMIDREVVYPPIYHTLPLPFKPKG